MRALGFLLVVLTAFTPTLARAQSGEPTLERASELRESGRHDEERAALRAIVDRECERGGDLDVARLAWLRLRDLAAEQGRLDEVEALQRELVERPCFDTRPRTLDEEEEQVGHASDTCPPRHPHEREPTDEERAILAVLWGAHRDPDAAAAWTAGIGRLRAALQRYPSGALLSRAYALVGEARRAGLPARAATLAEVLWEDGFRVRHGRRLWPFGDALIEHLEAARSWTEAGDDRRAIPHWRAVVEHYRADAPRGSASHRGLVRDLLEDARASLRAAEARASAPPR